MLWEAVKSTCHPSPLKFELHEGNITVMFALAVEVPSPELLTALVMFFLTSDSCSNLCAPVSFSHLSAILPIYHYVFTIFMHLYL